MNSRAVIAAAVLVGCGIGVTFLIGRAQPRRDIATLEGIQADPDQYGIPADDEGALPKAVADEMEYSFGKMILGSTESHAFEIRNGGDDVLKLKKGPSTCKCTLNDMPKDKVVELAPGDSMKVTLEWQPKSADEFFSQSATVWTNDPEHRELSFRVHGAVYHEVDLHPADIINAGLIIEKVGADATLVVTSSFYENLPEPTVTLDSDYVHATIEKATAEDTAAELVDVSSPQEHNAYQIHFHIDPNVPVGSFREVAKVRLNVGGLNWEHSVTIEARRAGPIKILPQPGTTFYSSVNLVDLGTFRADDGKRADLVLMIERTADETPIKITGVTSSVQFVKAQAVPDESLDDQLGSNMSGFRISVEVPPGTIPIDYARATAPKILIKTSSPTVPQIELRVEAHSN